MDKSIICIILFKYKFNLLKRSCLGYKSLIAEDFHFERKRCVFIELPHSKIRQKR